MAEPALTIIDGALSRLADRLRSAPESRLTRADDRLAGASIADASHELARWCATAAQLAISASHGAHPVVPTVPRLQPLASGDQLLVLGRELLAALAEAAMRPDGAAMRPDGGVDTLEAEFLEWIEQLRAVC